MRRVLAAVRGWFLAWADELDAYASPHRDGYLAGVADGLALLNGGTR